MRERIWEKRKTKQFLGIFQKRTSLGLIIVLFAKMMKLIEFSTQGMQKIIYYRDEQKLLQTI